MSHAEPAAQQPSVSTGPVSDAGVSEPRNGNGQSRSFFRAIKEGVLGRRSDGPTEATPVEIRAPDPVGAEPQPEPEPVVQAAPPAPTPEPEPEPAGPPRKGWWSNKE